MTFTIEPVTLSDFEKFMQLPGEDDLVNVPFKPLCWPVRRDGDAKARREYYHNRQRQRFLIDPSTRYVKCIDQSSGEIVSLANWHYYPNGYDTEKEHWKAIDALAPPGTTGERPPGFDFDLFASLSESMKLRDDWLPRGRAVWRK